MRDKLDQTIGEVAARVTLASVRGYRLVVAIAVVLTPLLGVYTQRHLGVNADMASMVSNDLPHRVLELDFERHFPVLHENLVVVVDAPTPEESMAAAQAIARRMERDPARYRHVFYPGGEFFEHNALLYADIEDVERFVDRLATTQPYLSSLAIDGSLRGLAKMMTRGVDAARDGEAPSPELGRMMARFSTAIAAYETHRPYRASWAEIIAGDGDAPPRRQVIVVQPVLNLSNVLAAEEPIRYARGLVEELHLDAARIRVRVTGDMALAYDELTTLQSQTVLASIASFAIVAITMVMAFRSARLTVVALLNMVVGLVCTMSFATVAIGHLNMVSVAFAVLFIGLSDDYGIHFCVRYRELVGLGRSHSDALEETAGDAGTSISICALTTATAFYAFVPTEFRGVAELGLISGTGMFINVLLCFTLLPALVTLVVPRRWRHGVPATAGPNVNHAASTHRPALPVRYPGLVAGGAFLVAFAATWLVPSAYFDGNPLNVRDPHAESVRAFRDLLRDGTGSLLDVSVIVDDPDEATALASRLRALPTVRSATTISDYVPEHQQEKIAVLTDAAFLMAPASSTSGAAARPTLAQQLDALRALVVALDELVRAGKVDGPVAGHAARLREDLDRLLAASMHPDDARAAISGLENALLGTLPAQLDSLRRMLAPERITVGTLPQPVRERLVSASGRTRIEVAPREDLTDETALASFIESVRSVAPRATGGAVGVYEGKRAIVHAFRQAFAFAVVAIAALLLVLWRSVIDTALAMAPLALAAILTTALGVLLHIPFNFADVIVLPLLFGLGVNSGIHLVERWRLGDVSVERLLDTSTARAVIYSSINTVGSFGTLGFATHRGIASMGQLLAIGVALTVLCNLWVLPALIALYDKRVTPPIASS
jgi:hopanoid biosynthesis associated RND transporter like protein HpnN